MTTKSVRPRQSSRAAISSIEKILMDLVNGDESPAARIAAAKLLLERITQSNDEITKTRNSKKDGDQEVVHREAIATAETLLAEFAAAKSSSLCGACQVAEASAPEPIDPRRSAEK